MSKASMKIVKPSKLNKGDFVGVIAPSDAILDKNKLRRGVKFLEDFGFRVILGKNIFKWHGDYMAGTDKERADDLNRMFADKRIKGVFCAAGGSSCNRLLPLIDFENIKKNPKIFVGFSDITTLLLAIYKKTGLVTFHGPNVINPSFLSKFSQKSLFEIITKNKAVGKIKKKEKWQVLKRGRGEARGVFLGGNLEIILNLAGTEYFPNFNNSILFWEEYGEPVEDIDMMFQHLKLTGTMDKIKGMVIGSQKTLFGKSEYKHPLEFKKAILEIVKPYNFPIIFNADFGHILNFVTLPIGIRARLNPRNASLEILESAVKDTE